MLAMDQTRVMTPKIFVFVFAVLGLGAAAWAFADRYKNQGTDTAPDRRPLVAIILTMVALLVSVTFLIAQPS